MNAEKMKIMLEKFIGANVSNVTFRSVGSEHGQQGNKQSYWRDYLLEHVWEPRLRGLQAEKEGILPRTISAQLCDELIARLEFAIGTIEPLPSKETEMYLWEAETSSIKVRGWASEEQVHYISGNEKNR